MPRDLRLLSAAVALSAAGDMLLVVVLALRVHDLTGSGFAVAALFGALMVPVVLLAPFAGRLVDRTETRRLLLCVSLLQAAIAAGLVFADGLAPILLLAALLGAGAAVAGPAEASLVPAVVDEQRLAKANGWVETARYVGFTAGPLLAGALTAAGGTRLGLAANAASFACVALAAALMHVRREPATAASASPPAASATPLAPSVSPSAASPAAASPAPRSTAAIGAPVASPATAAPAAGSPAAASPASPADDGLRLLFADPVLRVAIAAAVGALLVVSATMTAEVFYVRDVVGAGASGYALAYAGWMAGMVLGAVAIAPRVKASLALAALLALGVQGGAIAVASLWAVFAFVLAWNVVGGVGHGAKNVLLRTLIQQRVPKHQHGRAFAAYNAARNTAELGALAAGGVTVALLGAQTALLIAGLGPVIAAAIGLAALGYRPSNSLALSRRTADATSSGS